MPDPTSGPVKLTFESPDVGQSVRAGDGGERCPVVDLVAGLVLSGLAPAGDDVSHDPLAHLSLEVVVGVNTFLFGDSASGCLHEGDGSLRKFLREPGRNGNASRISVESFHIDTGILALLVSGQLLLDFLDFHRIPARSDDLLRLNVLGRDVHSDWHLLGPCLLLVTWWLFVPL